ncbi:protein rolling stone isoform X2 [Orussus abietinus]|uniref:protein rolling stone isoform X2 n=1 Tax=Orussus abietinus TaxID=222816 RepID=UPI0006258944|nr:protein rolling stone isoform X2 [Orussus abietinus]
MVLLTLHGPSSLRNLLELVGKCCTRRRAMVNRLCWRELARRWVRSKSEPPHARVFSEPKFQNNVSMWYLLYRWIVSIVWISITICSILELGSYTPRGDRYKWGIYLTNWGLSICTVQSLFSLYLVTKRWRRQRVAGFDPQLMKLSLVIKTYWYLVTVSSNLAISISIVYWGAVYNPKENRNDPLNISTHVFNSIFMIMDVCITNIPLNFKYFWWATIVEILYAFFTVIYHLAGGHNNLGKPYIYSIINWTNPQVTLLWIVSTMIMSMIVHCLLCCLTRIRDRLFFNIDRRLERTFPVSNDHPSSLVKNIGNIV